MNASGWLIKRWGCEPTAMIGKVNLVWLSDILTLRASDEQYKVVTTSNLIF